ncbi:MAG TPA: hypothetical protein VGG28_00110, partial [Kofleriaceae bacterium]
CGKADDQTKLMQEPAPPNQVEPPADLAIAVSIDGSAVSPIVAATLRSVKPDFVDAERRAWLIPTLVAGAAPAGSIVEASSPNGVSVKLVHPTSDGLEPVLFLTRRGEVIVSAVDPRDPFPDYHGRGGRLHRAGDSVPHVAPVARIAITHDSQLRDL